MKKLLALGLSLAMMASLSAVAFAAGTTEQQDPNHDGKADTVLVYTDAAEAPDASQNYVVTIPADVEVKWGDPLEQTAAVTVTGQLLTGSTIDIKAPGLKTLNKGEETLTVKMEDFAMTVTGNNTVLNESANIAFSVSGFESVTLGRYENTITFTVTPNLITK